MRPFYSTLVKLMAKVMLVLEETAFLFAHSYALHLHGCHFWTLCLLMLLIQLKPSLSLSSRPSRVSLSLTLVHLQFTWKTRRMSNSTEFHFDSKTFIHPFDTSTRKRATVQIIWMLMARCHHHKIPHSFSSSSSSSSGPQKANSMQVKFKRFLW